MLDPPIKVCLRRKSETPQSLFCKCVSAVFLKKIIKMYEKDWLTSLRRKLRVGIFIHKITAWYRALKYLTECDRCLSGVAMSTLCLNSSLSLSKLRDLRSPARGVVVLVRGVRGARGVMGGLLLRLTPRGVTPRGVVGVSLGVVGGWGGVIGLFPANKLLGFLDRIWQKVIKSQHINKTCKKELQTFN